MIKDMPKLESPFVRKEIDGNYVVTSQISEGYEWVFNDESVMAIEKLHGTNVSIVIEEGQIKSVWNRTERIPFFNKGKAHIIEGILESYKRGYMDMLEDGQFFGELIGEKVNGNPYKIEGHLWVPFNTYAQNHLKYKSWGKYPKDFDTISNWFKELMPLFAIRRGDKEGFVEGVVFTHPDGRMAKLRKDMFTWYNGERHKIHSPDEQAMYNALKSKSNKRDGSLDVNTREMGEDNRRNKNSLISGGQAPRTFSPEANNQMKVHNG